MGVEGERDYDALPVVILERIENKNERTVHTSRILSGQG